MRILLAFTLLTLVSCGSTTSSDPNQAEVKPSPPTPYIAVDARRVYYFQHKLLPEWTHTTGGRFYDALVENDLEKLRYAASEIVSPQYAEKIQSQYFPMHQAVVIEFPAPKAFPNCYFVLIKKNPKGFEYYTYEKTMNFGEDDPVMGVIGTWSVEGAHQNLGGRTYLSSKDFMQDILNPN